MIETPQSAPAYAPGTPIWVDLGTPDVAATAAFYGKLFGWEADILGPEAGGYGMLKSNGKIVAGIGPLQMEGQPSVWSTYLYSTDADVTAKAVVEAGGQVIVPPMDVMGQGRMAVFTDSTGAFISIWQPQEMLGAELFNEPVSLSWNELNSRDLAGSKAFYGKVFGYGSSSNDLGPHGEYVQWTIDGRTCAGGMTMPAQVPSDVPNFWLVYFAVENCDATVAQAQELGARVTVPPSDSPNGRFSVLIDPNGAPFAIIASA
jgi:predicted enzyme related to lactoylglutathione lyase